MTKSKKELVENLLRRRFGSLAPPPPATLQLSGGQDGRHRLRLSALTQARLDLEAMPTAELEEIVRVAEKEDWAALHAKEAADEQALFYHQADARANFSYWSKMAVWTLDEAIALSLGKSPAIVNWETVKGEDDRYVEKSFARSPFRQEYAQRRQLVRRALLVSDLSEPTKPEEFLTWALRTFDSAPAELVDQIRARGKHGADLEALATRVSELEAQVSASAGATGKWPWGDYETEFLRNLEAAAQRHWARFDPNDPSTASTSKDVTEWLIKEHKVPLRVAQIMAQILRSNDLRPGRR